MGQGQSGEPHTPTAEELSLRLAERFVRQCFSGVELYSFKDNFRSLADNDTSAGGFLYWKESTLVKFLSFPDCLEVGPILFRASSYIGAFPFPSLSPAILNFEALVKIVVIFTGRYKTVLKRQPDALKLLFRALAVYDRQGVIAESPGSDKTEPSVDAEEGGDYEPDDDDELSLAALDALDAIEVFGHIERSNINLACIPLDNMTKLIALLLVIAPLEPNQPIAEFSDRLTPEALGGLFQTAESLARSFKSRNGRGILYKEFRTTVKNSMPFLFDGFRPLFEHFLFSKKVNMSTKTESILRSDEKPPLLSKEGQILTMGLLSQLSFFIKGDQLWRRLRLLYAGSEAGFSMGSFETRVLKWTAPTILLVSGVRIPNPAETHNQQAFIDRIPSKKYPPGVEAPGGRVVFGVFLKAPWKASRKDHFGDASTLLFQLSPIHRVFAASPFSREYAYFNKSAGISFGSPLPQIQHHQHQSITPHFNLGQLSLTFDQSLQFGVFQNTGTGGAFKDTSALDEPVQDMFEIEEIEVWGCGGDEEAKEQQKAWEWEEREALLRRQITLPRGSSDFD